MGDVSAIPEHLFKYSDTCTQGADRIQAWVRTVLGPALRDYQAGGGVCDVIDGDVAQQVAAAYYTDRDVRTVGQAFLQAGGGGANLSAPVRASETDVNAAYRKLLQQQARAQAQERAGAALGKRMMGLPMKGHAYDAVMKELAGHADDPSFTAAFFGSLDQSRLWVALSLGGSHALATAYSGGRLNSRVTENVTRILALDSVPVDQPMDPTMKLQAPIKKVSAELFAALAENPRASRCFAESLTSGQLHRIFYAGAPHTQEFRQGLVHVLTVGMEQEPGSAGARALLNKISAGLWGGTESMTRSEWRPLLSPLKQLYETGVGKMGIDPPLPGASYGEVMSWFGANGAAVGDALGPFLRAMDDAAPNHELLKDVITGAYVNVIFMATEPLAPEGFPLEVAFTAGVGGAQSLYPADDDPILKWILSPIKDGAPLKAADANGKMALYGFNSMVVTLGARGLIRKRYSDGRFGPPVKFGDNPAANGETLRKVLRDPDSYVLGNGDGDPKTVLDASQYFFAPENGRISHFFSEAYKPHKK